MLHQDVLMADIDVGQWRNAQALLLHSAKGDRRLVVIHDAGRVLKQRRTDGGPVRAPVDRVEDPHDVARTLYEANREEIDLVVVMERDAVDTYFAQVQDAWDIEADLDVFVRGTYAALDDFPDGIVTHPGRARDTLGLQWRVGATHAEAEAAARAYVRPGTTAILAVHGDGRLWTSLVLDFDDEWKVTSITTADPSLVDITGTREDVLERLASWVEGSGKSVSLAIALDRAAADVLLTSPAAERAGALLRLLAQHTVSVGRAPEALRLG